MGFKTGFFGAFTRTYYPAALIAVINKLWASQADGLAPRTKLSLIAAELSRRNYHGRVYAKAQNVRPAYIKAYDAALADVDVLVMPTCIMTAPKNHRPESFDKTWRHAGHAPQRAKSDPIGVRGQTKRQLRVQDEDPRFGDSSAEQRGPLAAPSARLGHRPRPVRRSPSQEQPADGVTGLNRDREVNPRRADSWTRYRRLGELGYAPIRQNSAAVAQYPPFRSHSLR